MAPIGSKNKFKKILGGVCPRTLLQAYAFGARLGKLSVFILDPPLSYFKRALSRDIAVRCAEFIN